VCHAKPALEGGTKPFRVLVTRLGGNGLDSDRGFEQQFARTKQSSLLLLAIERRAEEPAKRPIERRRKGF
jgi:hypothetical protein